MAVTKYVYDGDTVLQETDGAGVTLTEYTSTGQGYGDLLSAFDGSAAKYYEPDALGSTDALADQFQAVVDRWRYRAFGSATQTLGTDSTPLTWVGRQGYYSDSETGLYQLGNGTRYYDPQTAQFLSSDPSGVEGGDSNLRRYVANNPTIHIDPSGLKCVISVHCWTVERLLIPLGTHCGLTIVDDTGYTVLDGGGGATNGIIVGRLGRLPKGWWVEIKAKKYPDSTCKCLMNYVAHFNSFNFPRYDLEGNSNWVLSCMVAACDIDLGGEKPGTSYGVAPCLEWVQTAISPSYPALGWKCLRYAKCPPPVELCLVAGGGAIVLPAK